VWDFFERGKISCDLMKITNGIFLINYIFYFYKILNGTEWN